MSDKWYQEWFGKLPNKEKEVFSYKLASVVSREWWNDLKEEDREYYLINIFFQINYPEISQANKKNKKGGVV